jgi:hypothetical protein
MPHTFPPGERRAVAARFRDGVKLANAAEAGDVKAALLVTALFNCGQLIERQSIDNAPLCELCARRVNDIRGGALVCFDPSLHLSVVRFYPLCGFCAGKNDREILETCKKLFPELDWLVALNEGDAP